MAGSLSADPTGYPAVQFSEDVWPRSREVVTQLSRGEPLLRQADAMSAPHTLDGDVHGGRESGRAVSDDPHVVGDPAGPLHDREDAILAEGRAIRDLELHDPGSARPQVELGLGHPVWPLRVMQGDEGIEDRLR